MGCSCCCSHAYSPYYATPVSGGGATTGTTTTSTTTSAVDPTGGGASDAAYAGQVQSQSGDMASDAQVAAQTVTTGTQDVQVADPVSTASTTSGGGPDPINTAASATTTTTPAPSTAATPVDTNTGGTSSTGSTNSGPAPIDTSAGSGRPAASEPATSGSGDMDDIAPEPGSGPDVEGGGGSVRQLAINWDGLTRPTGSYDPEIEEVVYDGLPQQATQQLRDLGVPEELVAYMAAIRPSQEEFAAVYTSIQEAVMAGDTIVVVNEGDGGPGDPTPDSGTGSADSSSDETSEPASVDGDAVETSDLPASGDADTHASGEPNPAWAGAWETRFAELLEEHPERDELMEAIPVNTTTEAELVNAYEALYEQGGLTPADFTADWRARFVEVLGDGPEASAKIDEIEAMGLSDVGYEYVLGQLAGAMADVDPSADSDDPVTADGTPPDNGWNDEWQTRFASVSALDENGAGLRKLTAEEIEYIRLNATSEAELQDAFDRLSGFSEESTWSDEWQETFENAQQIGPDGKLHDLTWQEIAAIKHGNFGDAHLQMMADHYTTQMEATPEERAEYGQQLKAAQDAAYDAASPTEKLILNATKLMGHAENPVIGGLFAYTIWGRSAFKAGFSMGGSGALNGLSTTGKISKLFASLPREISAIRQAKVGTGMVSRAAGAIRGAFSGGSSAASGGSGAVAGATSGASRVASVADDVVGQLSLFGDDAVAATGRAASTATAAASAGSSAASGAASSAGSQIPGQLSLFADDAAAAGTASTAAGGASKLATVSKWGGPAVMAALEGVNVFFTYKAEGEFGPETKKAIGGGVGGVAGAAAGAALAGAALGSVVPGAGTAVGFAVGAIGGTIGAVAGKQIGEFVGGLFG